MVRVRRWLHSFVFVAIAASAWPLIAHCSDRDPGWRHWHTSRIVRDHGYPVFTVDGKPFFIYGAAFFYERTPRDRWETTLRAYKRLGVNTIDLYVIWNWHQPNDAPADFAGTSDPRRDLLGLLRTIHDLGFKVVLRPGPVIRNEWRNGGYPDWLLTRPEYDMPLHEILEGRYPATATLQNAHADAAGREWLENATHRTYAAQWLRAVLHAVSPYAGDVIAVALDDDQGAYLDNDTWPAPHWRAYIGWLRSTVVSIAGSRVPLFINTYEMKVPAASPAWAWGNWYQSNAYAIGTHDLAELDFATGLLQTQIDRPVMQAEFQAGWLQGADEGIPRPADPSNTALALHELLRDGAHGIVNFPLQDTVYPDGWEVPWANWSYAWDAALTVDLHASPRYAPTTQFGAEVARYGVLLARTHPAFDAAIIWPPTLFRPTALTNSDFAYFADATIAIQQACRARAMSCELVDLRDVPTVRTPLIMPIVLSSHLRALMLPSMVKTLRSLQRKRRVAADPSRIPLAHAFRMMDATRLIANDGSFSFVDVVNPSQHMRVTPLGSLAPRSAQLYLLKGAHPVPARAVDEPARATPPPFQDEAALLLDNGHVRIGLAANAGARISDFSASGGENAASSIGLLRDAIDPEPTPSGRDYIATYTHPLPAGTFNRAYACVRSNVEEGAKLSCAYDAPDLPVGGGRFERTLTLRTDADAVLIDERVTPRDASSSARLESISGFAFDTSDTLQEGADFVRIVHHGEATTLAWRFDEVRRVELRRTRGAELVTLVFARPEVHLLLQKNRP